MPETSMRMYNNVMYVSISKRCTLKYTHRRRRRTYMCSLTRIRFKLNKFALRVLDDRKLGGWHNDTANSDITK